MAEIDWTAVVDAELADFSLAALPPTIKLPALPHAVALYLQKSNDPHSDVRELAQIVETDTGLTVELLRYVNSTFVGLRNKAKTVQQALALLGDRQSRMFLISVGMQAAVQARNSRLVNQASFWNATLQKAIFAREVAGLLKADGELAFAGAMLQDYLLPVLTNDLFDKYLNFTETREHQPDLWEYERQAFGWNHALAGACLSRRWQLPDDLTACVLYHHHGLKLLIHPTLGRSAAAAVALSALLPDQLRQCYRGLEHLLLLEEKWPAFNLRELIEIVDVKHKDLPFGIKNDFPLSRRCRPILEGHVTADSAAATVA